MQIELRTVSNWLLQHWDPIGVSSYPEAHDEYNGYVPTIVRFLDNGADPNRIADYLLYVEAERMGLPGRPERNLEAARKIVELWSEYVAQYRGD